VLPPMWDASMLNRLPVLIVEDEALIALELAIAVENIKGEVVGPVATVADALEALSLTSVMAAVLDANLLDRDVTPVALALIEKKIPFVVHSALGLPDDLRAMFPDLPFVPKPSRPADVVLRLAAEINAGRLAAEREAAA